MRDSTYSNSSKLYANVCAVSVLAAQIYVGFHSTREALCQVTADGEVLPAA